MINWGNWVINPIKTPAMASSTPHPPVPSPAHPLVLPTSLLLLVVLQLTRYSLSWGIYPFLLVPIPHFSFFLEFLLILTPLHSLSLSPGQYYDPSWSYQYDLLEHRIFDNCCFQIHRVGGFLVSPSTHLGFSNGRSLLPCGVVDLAKFTLSSPIFLMSSNLLSVGLPFLL